ncbi:Secreted protein acidic and rich in cysteine Ca binding region [Parelaphostrongylus tenuis]|uniref:Secreted protein acidic and rich in cysteine Ca binding region n=1 Tax=Parelaphostrongylus tenuis TaxID=148309 RepID=A0AAD5WLR2_PARTN|nr:Secreted protein acidic and rich in cysteine Ca binding region [Parelaphostrongylus tenuis]
MFASVDDNNDGELNAPEFADFERIVRSKAVETSRRALRVVDLDGSNTLTMDEARRIAFEHYGFNENDLAPFFAQADENEDGHLDGVEFAGFRSVIRSKAVRNAIEVLKEIDLDGDGLVSLSEAEAKTKREDDMDTPETAALFNIADQGKLTCSQFYHYMGNKSGKLDKVELADFIRLVRLSAIRFATDHFKSIEDTVRKTKSSDFMSSSSTKRSFFGMSNIHWRNIDLMAREFLANSKRRSFDTNRDHLVTVDELAHLIENKYSVPLDITKMFFHKVDVDDSGDLIPAEIVDFRHEIRKYVSEHPISFAEHEHDDKNSVESVDALTTSSRRTKSTTTTRTTIAPTTNSTATTTTFSTSSSSPLPRLRKRLSTTSTTSTTSTASTVTTATHAQTDSHLLHPLIQSSEFPTLLPSTRRKVTFRKHTTLTPQINDIEELSAVPEIFEGENAHVEFSNDRNSSIEKLTSYRRNVWKNRRFTNTPSTSAVETDAVPTPNTPSSRQPTIVARSLGFQSQQIGVVVSETSSMENQRTSKARTSSSAQTERLEKAVTTIKTQKSLKKTTPTARMAATAQGKITGTTTAQVVIATSPVVDLQYESVEVEVDENATDLFNKESKKTVNHRSRQQQGRSGVAVGYGNELQGQKKLAQHQKRTLNVPDSVEDEYLESETTEGSHDDEAIDVDDYSDENTQQK